jgi:hypothetical protein
MVYNPNAPKPKPNTYVQTAATPLAKSLATTTAAKPAVVTATKVPASPKGTTVIHGNVAKGAKDFSQDTVNWEMKYLENFQKGLGSSNQATVDALNKKYGTQITSSAKFDPGQLQKPQEADYRRQNPFAGYTQQFDVNTANDLTNRLKNGTGLSDTQMDYLNRLNDKWNLPGYDPSKAHLDQFSDAVEGSKDLSQWLGQKTDLSSLYNAIGNKPNEVFNKEFLEQLMAKQREAGGGDVTVDPAKFQTPEHIASLIEQMNGVLQPYTDIQKQSATSGFNETMQGNRNKWAGRGLLASGAAMAQEQQGANALAGQLAGIDATAQKEAIGHAFNYGQLGLQESDMRFGQQMQNREFDLNRSNQAVAQYLSALGFQEDQIQSYIGNMQNAKQMEMQDNQWSQEFGHTRQQSYLDNMFKGTQMKEDSRQFDTNLSEEQRQFNNDFALKEGQLTGTYRSYQNQQDIQKLNGLKQALSNPNLSSNEKTLLNKQLAELTGQFNAKGIDPNKLFDKNGKMILDRTAQKTMDQKNMEQDQSQFDKSYSLDKAKYGLERDRFSHDKNMDQAEFGLEQDKFGWTKEQTAIENSLKSRGLDIDQARVNLGWAEHNTDKDYKAHLKSLDLTEQQGKVATNGYMSQIMKYDSLEDALSYIAKNSETIANDGADVGAILDAVDAKFGSGSTDLLKGLSEEDSSSNFLPE